MDQSECPHHQSMLQVNGWTIILVWELQLVVKDMLTERRGKLKVTGPAGVALKRHGIIPVRDYHTLISTFIKKPDPLVNEPPPLPSPQATAELWQPCQAQVAYLSCSHRASVH